MAVEALRPPVSKELPTPSPDNSWFQGYGPVLKGIEGVTYNTSFLVLDNEKVGQHLQTIQELSTGFRSTIHGPLPITPAMQEQLIESKEYIKKTTGFTYEELETHRLLLLKTHWGYKKGNFPITFYH